MKLSALPFYNEYREQMIARPVIQLKRDEHDRIAHSNARHHRAPAGSHRGDGDAPGAFARQRWPLRPAPIRQLRSFDDLRDDQEAVAFGTIADCRRCGLTVDRRHLFADQRIGFPGRHVAYQILL